MQQYPEEKIPVLSTRDLIIFPGSTVPCVVKSEAGLRAVKAAKEGGGWIITLADRKDRRTEDEAGELNTVGVLCRVDEITLRSPKRSSDETKSRRALNVVLQGHERFKVVSLQDRGGFPMASGAIAPDRSDSDESVLQSLRASLETTVVEILEALPSDTAEIIEEVKKLKDARALSYLAAQYMQLPRADAQALLEENSLRNRILKLLELLVARRENLKVQSKIRETLSEELGKKQREAILREQLKAIQEELGDNVAGTSTEDYRTKVEALGMPDEAKQIALREVARLERIGDQAAESHVIRNYLDLLCEMPWNKMSSGEINIDTAEKVLARDHYGLKDIKKRILEHLSVLKLRNEKRGSILLFVGPPGVGKTSLGKSIAEALGREFVRVSLGGVRDDADIRGHRRTYVGALPGRIIDGIRRAKSKDPVFILDEVDKVARGWGGDPSSALLEVLDPEQNSKFHDHYLDVAFDLSQVLFICTANSMETIPTPLLDRMEVIPLSGYTADEKFHIAKNHLLPAELEAHGLKKDQVVLQDEQLHQIIEGYTREAGVRSLRRELAKVARSAAAAIVRSAEKVEPLDQVVVSEAHLREALGAPKFEREDLHTGDAPGVVTGMAWTPVGGDTLFVEAALIPGEGKTTVTGQLGDVMKESSQIAVALARARLEGIAPSVLFKDKDIHIHVPGGAIPKDGPSAGVTMFTAVASMMLRIPVDPKLAMTGEVTLRGKVMPVGGIKEKVLAASRAGITEIILPKRNAKDLEEIPEETRNAIKFYFVSDVNELAKKVFGPTVEKLAGGSIGNASSSLTSSGLKEVHLHSSVES